MSAITPNPDNTAAGQDGDPSPVKPFSGEATSVVLIDQLIDQERFNSPETKKPNSSKGSMRKMSAKVAVDTDGVVQERALEMSEVSEETEEDPSKPDFVLSAKWNWRVPYAATFDARESKPWGLAQLPFQELAYHTYQTVFIQLFVAGCIVLNFVIAALSRQLGNNPVFDAFETFFLVIFTVELVLNMYGSWCNLFWQSSWNMFDFVVVVTSILAAILPDLPGISVLRLFRAFRVVRLFKRVETLRIIIEGIIASLPGVFNAFAVTTILMGIWGIMGVDFYASYMQDEFGSFFKAMYTMWKMMTLEGWTDIADALIYDNNLPFAAIYFISYTFLVGMVMTNVVVAILLERYLASTDGQKSKDADNGGEQVWNNIVDEAVGALTSGQYEKALSLSRALATPVKSDEDMDEERFLKWARNRGLIPVEEPGSPKHPVQVGKVVTKSGNTPATDTSATQGGFAMSGKQFVAAAQPLSVDMFGTRVLALPQTFQVSSNRGWLAATRVEVPGTGDSRPQCAQLEMKVTVLGAECWAE